MKLNKKYIFSFIIALILGGEILFNTNDARAAVLSGNIDDTGMVTGTIGATYYNTNSWQDMKDTYAAVTPDTSSNYTVYFNVIGDVIGNSVMTNRNSVINNKSLTINGNGHTLYVDNDTNTDTGTGGNGGSGSQLAFGSNQNISADTTLKVQNANIINNITGGIFQMNGRNALATTIYQDVTVTNGAATVAAQPIRNDNGKILFYGNNTFNILQQHDLATTGLSGSDNQGEWVQGGAWIEVVSGNTTLNQSWGRDQPLYTYGNSSHSLVVNDDASLVWNLNDTYCMYYDDGNSGPMVWDIKDRATFDVFGTQATASRSSSGWFLGVANNSWTVNVGQDSRLGVSTGGGNINLNGFNGGPVNWNFNEGSSVLFNNLSTDNLIAGAPGVGSGMTLNNPKTVTLNTLGDRVFSSNVGVRFPITIAGEGLRTHASDKSWDFTVPFDLDAPNRTTIDAASGDLWYRQNVGVITGLGSASGTSTLSPNPYSTDSFTKIASSGYISWYRPFGYWIESGTSNMQRSFNISLDPSAINGTPLDGSWSDMRGGTSTQTLTVGDDRGQDPNYHVTIQMLENDYPESIQYFWVDPSSGGSKELTEGTSVPIASVTSDSSLPSWISMTGAGAYYTMTFNANQGINIKANNHLLLANNQKAGSFQYTIANGPA